MDGLSLMLEKAQRSFSEGEKLALATPENVQPAPPKRISGQAA